MFENVFSVLLLTRSLLNERCTNFLRPTHSNNKYSFPSPQTLQFLSERGKRTMENKISQIRNYIFLTHFGEIWRFMTQINMRNIVYRKILVHECFGKYLNKADGDSGGGGLSQDYFLWSLIWIHMSGEDLFTETLISSKFILQVSLNKNIY